MSIGNTFDIYIYIYNNNATGVVIIYNILRLGYLLCNKSHIKTINQIVYFLV